MSNGSILPIGATPWELALEDTSAGRWPLPADLIKAVTRAYECPAELLGYLAWGRSADLWDPEWPEALKRLVTHRAIPDQRLKGSLELHERYLSYVGVKLIRAITPPYGLVLGRRRTPAEIDALLAGMPEIRVYPFAKARAAGKRVFWSHSFYDAGAGWSPDEATLVHQQRAELIRDGRTQRLSVAEVPPETADQNLGLFARLFLPHRWSGARILGRGHVSRQRRWGPHGATRYVVSYVAVENAAGRRTVSHGFAPAEVEPRRIFASHPVSAFKAWVGHRGPRRRFWMASRAGDFIYDSLRLWEGERAARNARRRSFWSHSWRNVPTHNSVLSIAVATPAPKRKRWWGGPFAGAMRPHDNTRLSQALAAVRAASLPHETNLVDIETAFERRFYGDN